MKIKWNYILLVFSFFTGCCLPGVDTGSGPGCPAPLAGAPDEELGGVEADGLDLVRRGVVREEEGHRVQRLDCRLGRAGNKPSRSLNQGESHYKGLLLVLSAYKRFHNQDTVLR